jgi:hypothetical protein
MKKILSLFCAVALALGVSAQPIALEKVTAKNFKAENSFAKAELKKAPAVKKAPAATIEGWTELGQAVVTETFGAPFGYDEDVYKTTVYKNNTTEGLYAIDNEWYDESEGADSIIQIHAEDPELCYILPTSLTYTNENYGFLQTLSVGGRYLDAYPTYTAAQIAANIGTGTDIWGKKVKNTITFAEDAMLVCLTAAKSGQPGYYYGKRLIIELPDLTAPVITAANEVSIGAEKAIFAIVADDDVDVVDSLTFTIKNGEAVLEAAAKTTNGQLTIAGLTKNTAYNLTLIATDRAGRASEAFAFSFTTIAEDDTQAPTFAKAEVKEVSDKWATVTVEATDNVTAAADLLFVVTFADESSVELAATEGVIKIAGLTPETKYDVTVAAKDKAGNKSEAKALSFTTLELIPIVLNVDWVQAQYYSEYSEDGAQNYELSFWQGDSCILFDMYVPEVKALSGVYSTSNGTIGTQYSYINCGSKIKIVAAVVSMEFVEYSDAQNGQGIYKAAFQAMGEDGNLYIGGVEIVVRTFYKSGDSQYYYPMSGEVPVELTMTKATATYGEADNYIEYVLSDDNYDFYFRIYLAEGLTDVENGKTYTYAEDMKGYDTYSYGDAGNDNYIDYASAEFVKTAADGKITIKADILDTTGQKWSLTYEADDEGTAIDNAKAGVKATKRIVNGQMVIRANGQEFNAQGVEIR